MGTIRPKKAGAHGEGDASSHAKLSKKHAASMAISRAVMRGAVGSQ
jgi:hypothetical protein